MKFSLKKLPGNKAEISITIPYEKTTPFLPSSAQRLAFQKKIAGFRPGKAPYEVIKQHFGEAEILKEALTDIIQDSYLNIIQKEKITPIEKPYVEVIQATPLKDVICKITVSLFPKVKIGDITKIKIEKKEIKIDNKDVDQSIKYLAESRSKESLVDRSIKENDVVVLDMDLKQNKVAIEGGTALNHKIIMSESYYIPGFKKHLIGLKAGEKKTFPLEFPKEYYNKTLAGKKVDCSVKIKGVYEREAPKINDDFAKSLGNFKNLDELKKQIKNNLKKEKEIKEEERQELELINKLIEISEFEEMPEIILREEVKKMIEELSGNLSQQGIKLDDYLNHLKKTEEDLKKDFLPEAERRAKIHFLLVAYGQENKIKVKEEEINKAIKEKLDQYPDPELQDRINDERYRNYLITHLTYQKILKELKEKIIK